MSATTLYRWSALAGLLSGLFIIMGKLLIPLSNPRPGEIFDFLSPLFALFFVVGLYLYQRIQAGLFGFVAFVVLYLGLVAVVCLDYFGAFMRLELPAGTADQLMEGPMAPVFVGSLLFFLVGEILFGISVIRAGVFSKIATVLFMVGLAPVALHLSGIFPEIVVIISSILTGIGLIWWSAELYGKAGNVAVLV